MSELKSRQVKVPQKRTQIPKPQRSARDGGSSPADRLPRGALYLVCTLEAPETSHKPCHPEHPPEEAQMRKWLFQMWGTFFSQVMLIHRLAVQMGPQNAPCFFMFLIMGPVITSHGSGLKRIPAHGWTAGGNAPTQASESQASSEPSVMARAQ